MQNSHIIGLQSSDTDDVGFQEEGDQMQNNDPIRNNQVEKRGNDDNEQNDYVTIRGNSDAK